MTLESSATLKHRSQLWNLAAEERMQLGTCLGGARHLQGNAQRLIICAPERSHPLACDTICLKLESSRMESS